VNGPDVITSLRLIGFHAGVQYFEGVNRDGTPSGLVFARRINGELYVWFGTSVAHAEVICSAQNGAQRVTGDVQMFRLLAEPDVLRSVDPSWSNG
jgi:hypothetical protein